MIGCDMHMRLGSEAHALCSTAICLLHGASVFYPYIDLLREVERSIDLRSVDDGKMHVLTLM